MEAGRHERIVPCRPQVGLHQAALASGCGAGPFENTLLRSQHLGAIDFEERDPGWPGQAKRPGVHAGGEQDNLSCIARRLKQKLVEEPRANRQVGMRGAGALQLAEQAKALVSR